MLVNFKLFLLAAAAAVMTATADDLNVDVILPPPASKGADLPEALLIFIPGGKVPSTYYTKTVAAIQEQSNLRLWGVVPSIPGKLCIAFCAAGPICTLRNRITDAMKAAKNLGYTGPESGPTVFVAGHSLGGICSDTLVKKYAGTDTSYGGLVLMGAYVSKRDVENYPVPVLTIGAELDAGGARPGSLYKSLVTSDAAATKQGQALDGEWQLQHKPVAILPGMDHSSFCPGFHVPKDVFPAETSLEDGLSMIGSISAAFLNLNTPQARSIVSMSVTKLYKQAQYTRSLLAGVKTALALEGTATRATWCEEAQRLVADLSPQDWARVNIKTAAYLDQTSGFMNSRVKTSGGGAGILDLEISGHNEGYSVTDLADECLQSARELGCKMASGARLARELGTTNLGNDVSCGQINKYAFEQANVALSQTNEGKASLARFQRKGRSILFSGDHHPFKNIGPLFISGHMDTKDCTPSSACLNVSSLALGPLHDVQYCKVLSPARVVDYIMSDSLRNTTTCA